MDITIKETGESKTLSIIDPRTGVNWVQDFIGNTGALNDGQFRYDDETGSYECTQETYDWWVKVADEHETLSSRIEELAADYGREAVETVVLSVNANDLETEPAMINQALDEAFSGSMSDDELDEHEAAMAFEELGD